MKRLLITAIAFLLAVSAHAEDSPQFRGPGGLGVSKESALPIRWSAQENIRWKAALPGRGLSCPVVAGGRVFVTACTGPEQKRLHVLCFDAATGKELWQRQLWATGTTLCHPKTCMAAPTPVSDGECVIALFATADLVCYDRDGNLLWYRSLAGDYPTVGNNVGMAASPILWKDLLLLCLENAGESFAAGIDKRTGLNRWKTGRPRGINWVTPLMVRDGKRASVAFMSGDSLFVHDAETGKKIWSVTGKSFSTIPSPVTGDGMIFTPGGKFSAVRSDKPEIVWETNKLPTSYSSPLYYRGLVYALTARGVLNCADGATGRLLWSRRFEGEFSASPLAADGKIYLVNEEGATTVLQAGVEPQVLSVNPLPEMFLANPVAADGAIYLRSDKHLYCVAVKK
jgi:outer membrane protein assembly factor BamB